MLTEILRLPATRMMAITTLLFSIIPTGTTVLYLLNRKLFLELDIFRMILVSSMYVIPYVFFWFLNIVLAMTLAIQSNWIEECKGKNEIEDHKQIGQSEIFNAISASSLVTSIIIYTYLAIAFAGKVVFNGDAIKLNTKHYIMCNSLFPVLVLIILIITMQLIDKKYSSLKARLYKQNLNNA